MRTGIDEDGEIPEDIEEDLVQSGRFLFRSSAYRENNRVPSALGKNCPLCCAQHNGSLLESAEGLHR